MTDILQNHYGIQIIEYMTMDLLIQYHRDFGQIYTSDIAMNSGLYEKFHNVN